MNSEYRVAWWKVFTWCIVLGILFCTIPGRVVLLILLPLGSSVQDDAIVIVGIVLITIALTIAAVLGYFSRVILFLVRLLFLTRREKLKREDIERGDY